MSMSRGVGIWWDWAFPLWIFLLLVEKWISSGDQAAPKSITFDRYSFRYGRKAPEMMSRII